MTYKPLSCVCGSYYVTQRLVLAIMLQLCLLNAYHLRMVYNIAVTEMIKHPEPNDTSTNYVDSCPELVYEAVVSDKESLFDWDPQWESFTMYSFYIGYLISHVPGGWLGDKFGGRHVMGTCMVISAVITAIFPFSISMIERGDIVAVFLRMVLGFSQGPLFPVVSTFIQHWVPPSQRTFLGGIAYGGSNIGTVTGASLTGVIIKQTKQWYAPFYIWATATGIWYAFYLLTVFSYPDTHPFITDEEKEYLVKGIPEHKSFKVPWRPILTSMSFWALFFGQFAHHFLFFTLVTYLPKYLKDILKMNVQNNALFTAIPFLLLYFFALLVCYLTDIVISRGWVSIQLARKVNTAFASIVPGGFLVLAGFLGCSRVGVVICTTAGVTSLAPFYAGMKVNVNDVTVHYAGTIMAIINGLGSTAGIIGPFLVGYLTENKSLESWQSVFYITMGVSTCCAIFYCIFASGERQEWDYPEETQ
nr:unnamed protein product [Callosobruchus chinensis]